MWRSAVQVCLGLHPNFSFEIPRLYTYFYMSEDDSYDTDRGYGGLAQLARAPALQAGGQRFESVILHVSENFRIGDARSQSLKILHVSENFRIGDARSQS